MSSIEVILDGGPIAIADVIAVAHHGAKVSLSERAVGRMNQGRKVVESAVDRNDTVYGVTTGFGALANVRVERSDLESMQLSLLRSHAAGVGSKLPTRLVRAMMLLRARTLATGYSGVRPVIAQRLLDLLNSWIHPVVPEHGSVGASGDLAQLAHLALPLVGEGDVELGGSVIPAKKALADAGISAVTLSYKEGLALLNGTEAMLAAGCLAVAAADNLAKVADIICAMSVEALLGSDRPFESRLHEIRPHPGQRDSAANLRKLLSESSIVASHRDSSHAVQDAYSVRCAPQVHGACRDVISNSRSVFERELASVTDNPVVFVDTSEVLSTGNFHGEPLGFALDFMAAALSEFGSISERRTDRLLDPNHSSGLPPFLSPDAGRNSGLMLGQYTQAALVVENRMLSNPSTTDTVPTSGSQEDHVSMGWNSALKLHRVIPNVGRILAIEAISAAQGIDLREPLKPAAGTAAAHELIRQMVPSLKEDRILSPEIETIYENAVANGSMVDFVERTVGPLL